MCYTIYEMYLWKLYLYKYCISIVERLLIVGNTVYLIPWQAQYLFMLISKHLISLKIGGLLLISTNCILAVQLRFASLCLWFPFYQSVDPSHLPCYSAEWLTLLLKQIAFSTRHEILMTCEAQAFLLTKTNRYNANFIFKTPLPW